MIIEIDERLPQTQREEVFFHEVGEALTYYMRFKYSEIYTRDKEPHDYFSRYMSLLWFILKENKLLR